MKKGSTYELVLTALFLAIIIIMAFTSLGYIPLVVINATIIHIPVILGALFLGPKKGAFLGFTFGLTSFLNNTFKAATLSAFVFSPVLAVGVVGWTGIFRSMYICFVPRILVGVIPYYVYLFVRMLLGTQNKFLRGLINVIASLFLLIALKAFLAKLLGWSILAWLCGIVAGVLLFGLLHLMGNKFKSTNLALAYAGLSGAFTNTLLVMSGIYFLYKDAYAEALGIAGDAVLDTIMGVVTFNGVVESVVAAILVAGIGIVLVHIKPIKGILKSKDE